MNHQKFIQMELLIVLIFQHFTIKNVHEQEQTCP